MALIEINKDPSRQELAWFGLIFALFFGVVGVLLRWHFEIPRAAHGVWASAAVVAVLYYAIPALRRPLYLGWMYLTYPLGWVLSHVLLAIIYYVVFTLIGLLLRLLGRDPLERRLDRDAKSYWREHRPGGDPDRYLRQF